MPNNTTTYQKKRVGESLVYCVSMELWFIAAVTGALLAGVSNFFFKIAAVRGYNAKLFSLYGSVTSIVIACGGLFMTKQSLDLFTWMSLLVFIGGAIAAIGGISKIYALRHIDSTIYFPLFKLLAPALAIVAGVSFFNETFSTFQWIGMMLGITVPLMLITKKEDGRQTNLLVGLLFVGLTAVISAGTAIINKIAIDFSFTIFETLFYVSAGIFFGAGSLLVIQDGFRSIVSQIKKDTSIPLVFLSFMRSFLISGAVFAMLYAYTQGGTLAIVQTVHSMYILIPIVLSIFIYKEHWNMQKVVAVVLSVVALVFLN